ncbi:C4-dicarboxylic acid transporter DauA [Cellvibrio sp. PSBB023]|uniref:C4-dicarboxylic acid transporter DauA n=1 Tax=Cellvibrio sp. PSBB023 TaxID=1945512 RepID=UPI00099030AE|nr:C4-dicarboxylic acid transporter DauA [Cellvibrio sp. PSBB023]AQT60306.1 C4-dicarboxylic acid transporter DauA [Cellvibrio sp. PSBB023]
MPHRAHLFSLRIGHALREACITEPYAGSRFTRDLLAGITVGVIAIPLAMALAIASGVPPQYGLYTAIIAGFLIPLLGGSRFSISGPTAAFVVILYPIAQKYGLGGLLVASVMAGGILVLMALLRLGRLIEYIPEAVTLGFTAGIAVVIATLQIKDFLGLQLTQIPEHYLEKLWLLAQHLPDFYWPSFIVAAVTFVMMLLWPLLKLPVPPHLPALIIGTLVALLLNQTGFDVDTIGSRFSYTLADGTSGLGIPPQLPHFEWPWLQAGANGEAIQWSWRVLQDLLAAAFAIAMLGAIESLLCAVVLDGMSGKRHSANSELLGQGIANIITPFFGGITATAALARSAASIKAGAESPVAGMIHALVVLLGLVVLAPLLAYLPMPAMAALLVMVAWGMSEAHKAVHLLKTAPRGDIWVFITCFALTVVFDMVIAITAGIVLAALLFMKEIAAMTHVDDLSGEGDKPLPENWRAFSISGPLFFAAADRVFGELSTLCSAQQHIILSLKEVSLLDAGGLSALDKLITKCEKNNTELILTDIPKQPLSTLAHAHIKPIKGVLRFYLTLDEARKAVVSELQAERDQ